MKNLLLFLALSTAFVFSSCEGDPGPPGPPGINILGQVFEVNSQFTYNNTQNTYSSPFYEFPFEVFESDAVLVYRFSGQDNTVNPPADVWTQLPQNVFYQDGTGDIFQYNFNHTFFDVQFTIEGNFDLTNIDPVDVNNQIFRVAVVPAEFAETNPTMEELMSADDIEFVSFESL